MDVSIAFNRLIETRMATKTALFSFTLRQGQSIGPSALRSLWIRACGSVDADVGRRLSGRSSDRHVYSLYASQSLGDLASVERRLRQLFAAAKLEAGSCRGCHLQLSAVELDRIRKLPADAIVHCVECGRILVR